MSAVARDRLPKALTSIWTAAFVAKFFADGPCLGAERKHLLRAWSLTPRRAAGAAAGGAAAS